MPLAFKKHGEPDNVGMSTDWQAYSTPEETRLRASRFGKDPANYGVMQALVETVRDIDGQDVKHTPDLPHGNRAHTDVLGPDDPEARLSLMRSFDQWAVPVPSDAA